jgi:hypothetical protein
VGEEVEVEEEEEDEDVDGVSRRRRGGKQKARRAAQVWVRTCGRHLRASETNAAPLVGVAGRGTGL